MKSISIGIVDPHPVHAEGVKALLSRNERFSVVRIGYTTGDILTICARDRPDFLITEIDMAGYPFKEILGASSFFPATKIIVLTDMTEEEAIMQALAGRARGYVLKNRAQIDLTMAIELAGKDKIYLSPIIGSRIMDAALNKIRIYTILH